VAMGGPCFAGAAVAVGARERPMPGEFLISVGATYVLFGYIGDMVGARECEVSGGGRGNLVVCPWRVAIGGCRIRYI
jgi:hypothetical protein